MSAAFVQSKSKSWFGSSGTTETITFTSNITAGNLIVVVVAWQTTLSTLTSVSDATTNYTLIDTVSEGTLGSLATLYLKNVPGGATTLTATWGADPGFGYLAAHEVSGCDTTAPLDQHVTNSQVAPGTGTDAV